MSDLQSELLILPRKRPMEPAPLNLETVLSSRYGWILMYKDGKKASDICRTVGVSRKTFYKWRKRFIESGEDSKSLLDKSRKPHHCPRTTPVEILNILRKEKFETGYGQRRLSRLMKEKYNISLSERTIWKHLRRTTDWTTPPNEQPNL